MNKKQTLLALSLVAIGLPVIAATYQFKHPVPGVKAPPTLASCTLDSTTVSSGQSITAYQAASVPFGSQCVSESRACTNGILSGTFTATSCQVEQQVVGTQNCLFGTTEVPHNSTIVAWQNATVPFSFSCVSENRPCTNGVLGGSYLHASCEVSAPADCSAGSHGTTGQPIYTVPAIVHNAPNIILNSAPVPITNGSNVYEASFSCWNGNFYKQIEGIAQTNCDANYHQVGNACVADTYSATMGTPYTFANIAPGNTDSQIVTITNQGNIAITPTFTTSDPVFTVSGCTASLAPGASCQATLSFTPVILGLVNGTVTLKHNTTTLASVNVSGTGYVATVGIAQYTGYRGWADGTLAESCQAYLTGQGAYSYQGVTGSGLYKVNNGGSPVIVWCDQTTAGGGWTRVYLASSPNVSSMTGHTYLAASVAAQASEAMIAYSTSSGSLISNSGTYFSIPTDWKTTPPMNYSQQTAYVTAITADGGISTPNTILRYGSGYFNFNCADSWTGPTAWGRVCINGASKVFWNAFAAANSDLCPLSFSYSGDACTSERIFTIFVR